MRIHPSIRGLVVLTGLLCCALLATGCAKSSSSGGSQQAPSSPATAGQVEPPDDEPPAQPTEPAPSGDGGTAPTKPDHDVVPLADCDPSKIRCRRMTPQCPEGQVASVSGSCFGPCVAIERCACSATLACPQPDQHACWRNQHCGPYVR
jgi:hypothetical protein